MYLLLFSTSTGFLSMCGGRDGGVTTGNLLSRHFFLGGSPGTLQLIGPIRRRLVPLVKLFHFINLPDM